MEGGSGTLVIRALTASGKPVSGLSCVLIPDVPNAFHTGDTAWSTGETGECRIENAGATDYSIRLERFENGRLLVVGQGRASVKRDSVAETRILVNVR